ncbi:MAG TPA: hypothetical protein VH538_09740 [Gaiellaceae bacterium]|jgi:hypothetical protein
MAGDGQSRSEELDQVRRMLFPDLPPDEGWARIDAAIAGAAAEQRAPAPDLPDDLLELLRRLLRESD